MVLHKKFSSYFYFMLSNLSLLQQCGFITFCRIKITFCNALKKIDLSFDQITNYGNL